MTNKILIFAVVLIHESRRRSSTLKKYCKHIPCPLQMHRSAHSFRPIRSGNMFVTSAATTQVMKLKFREQKAITIGNVNAFHDRSHMDDVISLTIIWIRENARDHIEEQNRDIS